MMKKTILASLAFAAAFGGTVSAAPNTPPKDGLPPVLTDTEVFQWKTRRGTNAYADTPRNMIMGESNVLNVRTKTVTPPTPTTIGGGNPNMSLADQQALLNQRIAEENKKNQEEYAKQQAETKAENCKTARMNRDMIDKTNASNRAELAPKYDADIAKYCN